MCRKLTLLIGLSVVLAGTTLAAPPLPLDLIPQDACIGLSIRDLATLKVKSDKLFKDRNDIPRLSQVFDMAYKEMQLGWKVDEKKAAAIICAAGSLGGFAKDANPEMSFQIGTVLPYQDLDAVAKAWSVKAADLKKGTPLKVPGKLFEPRFDMAWAGARDGVAYISGSEKAVAAWMQAKTLRQRLSPAHVKRLDAADGMVYFGPPLLRIGINNINAEWVPDGLTEGEATAYRRVNRAVRETRFGMLAFRLDDGVGVDLTAGFDPAGKESQALLKAFNAPGRTSSLAGLPDHAGLVGALSLIGADDLNTEIARVLASEVWLGLRNGPIFLESDTVHFRRIFGDLYAKLKAGRAALYQSPEKQLALVAILEPKNAATFLTDIGAMARVVDDKEFDPTASAGKAEIEKLVADLGSDDFDVREAASTKLGLIGAPALPALGKAEKSTDAEVRRRAGELRTQIEQVAALRKKELAGGLLKQAFHPTFGWKANAEERAGIKVHHLTMHFDAVDAPYAGWLKEVFGPDWNRIRLAATGDKVVVMIGSNTGLYEEALKNVRAGLPGLEATPALANFRKQVSPGRRAELHLALTRLQALTMPAANLPKDFKVTATLSSVALRTGPADIGLDFWVPPDAVTDGLLWWR